MESVPWSNIRFSMQEEGTSYELPQHNQGLSASARHSQAQRFPHSNRHVQPSPSPDCEEAVGVMILAVGGHLAGVDPQLLQLATHLRQLRGGRRMRGRAGGQAVGGSASRGWTPGFKAESGGVHCRARPAGRPRAEPQPGDQLGERRRFGRGLRLAAGVAGSRGGVQQTHLRATDLAE